MLPPQRRCGSVLTAVGWNRAGHLERVAGRLVWSEPCCFLPWGHNHWEASAAEWVAAVPRCVHCCDRRWAHAQVKLERGAWPPSFVHRPSPLSLACRHKAEASGTFLHSGTEVCSWLLPKPRRTNQNKMTEEVTCNQSPSSYCSNGHEVVQPVPAV